MGVLQQLADELGMSTDDVRTGLEPSEALSPLLFLIDPTTGKVTSTLLPANQARAHCASAGNLPAGTSVVPFDTADYGPFDALNHRYFVSTSGYYLVTGQLSVASTASGQTLEAAITKDENVNALMSFGSSTKSSAGGDLLDSVIADLLFFNEGEHIELAARSSASLAMQVNAQGSRNYISIVQVA